MSSTAHQQVMPKPMNGPIVPHYTDGEVNEWSELLTNEQEVAVQPLEVTQTPTVFRSMKDQGWKMSQNPIIVNKLNSARPIIGPRDWLELRQQSSEVQLTSTNQHYTHTTETRLPPPPPPTTVPPSVPPQPPPKKFHSGQGNAKSSPAPPIPRGKPTISNDNFSASNPISNVSDKSFKRNSSLTDKQVNDLDYDNHQPYLLFSTGTLGKHLSITS
jgi:hypothetical protein